MSGPCPSKGPRAAAGRGRRRCDHEGVVRSGTGDPIGVRVDTQQPAVELGHPHRPAASCDGPGLALRGDARQHLTRLAVDAGKPTAGAVQRHPCRTGGDGHRGRLARADRDPADRCAADGVENADAAADVRHPQPSPPPRRCPRRGAQARHPHAAVRTASAAPTTPMTWWRRLGGCSPRSPSRSCTSISGPRRVATWESNLGHARFLVDARPMVGDPWRRRIASGDRRRTPAPGGRR